VGVVFGFTVLGFLIGKLFNSSVSVFIG